MRHFDAEAAHARRVERQVDIVLLGASPPVHSGFHPDRDLAFDGPYADVGSRATMAATQSGGRAGTMRMTAFQGGGFGASSSRGEKSSMSALNKSRLPQIRRVVPGRHGPDLFGHHPGEDHRFRPVTRSAGGLGRAAAGGECRPEAGDRQAARGAASSRAVVAAEDEGQRHGEGRRVRAARQGGPRGKGRKTERLAIHEERVIGRPSRPAPGSRAEDFIVQDLVLRPHVVRIRRDAG